MSRRKKIKPIDLTAAIDEILSKYGDEVFDVLGEAIKETSEEAMQELRSVTKFSPKGNPTGAYSQSWEYKQVQVSRLKTEAVVYNENHYRLTHLLENGHALRRGGRTYGRVQAYPHIAPINDKAQENVIKKVEEKISDL